MHGFLHLVRSLFMLLITITSLLWDTAFTILKQTYKVNVNGLNNLPLKGGVLLLGNHVSWIDWLILQIATPRPIKFVMYKSFYNHWYIKWFFKLFRVIPIGLRYK